MKKIPAAQTINFAYTFTFGHLGAIIGLVWLPLVLWSVGEYFVLAHQYRALSGALAAGDAFTAAQANLAGFGWSLATLFLWSIMSVAVVRQAMGLRKGPAVVHFAVGGTELRVFTAMIGLIFVLALFVIALVTGVLTLDKALASSPAMQNYMVPVVTLLGLVALLYSVMRLSFFIVPVAVAEKRIGLSRSWELASGNVGRIVLIGLAVFLPAFIALGMVQAVIIGPAGLGGAGLAALGKGGDPALALQGGALQLQLQIMADHLPSIIGITLVTSPFLLGLQLAPAAFAYQALLGGSPVKG